MRNGGGSMNRKPSTCKWVAAMAFTEEYLVELLGLPRETRVGFVDDLLTRSTKVAFFLPAKDESTPPEPFKFMGCILSWKLTAEGQIPAFTAEVDMELANKLHAERVLKEYEDARREIWKLSCAPRP